ncbi:MAG: hypothetical protein K1X70_16940 [Leptospirales bacterium]|nr:hypothetical protein [Leptospirales bacterium]HNE23867.1 hypothetical protein [Leptospiraceae bacterium]
MPVLIQLWCIVLRDFAWQYLLLERKLEFAAKRVLINLRALLRLEHKNGKVK